MIFWFGDADARAFFPLRRWRLSESAGKGEAMTRGLKARMFRSGSWI